MDPRTFSYYSLNAAAFASRDALSSPLSPGITRYFRLPSPEGCRVLDVGAGSGRDAAVLASRGYSADRPGRAAALFERCGFA